MKQKNFLFVDIVSSLFLVLILFTNFLSLNYITGGSITVSLIISVVLALCYYFLVDLLKKNKEVLVKTKMMHFSSIFVVTFVGLSLISFYLMQHLINIEFNCKDAIKNETEFKLAQVDSLVSTYKSQSSKDLQDLTASLNTLLREYKKMPSSVELSDSLKNAPFFIDETILSNPRSIDVEQVTSSAVSPIELKILNNTKNLDSTVTLNSDKKRDVFRNWKRMSLISAYDDLNNYASTVQVNVDKMLKELPINKKATSISINKSKLPLDVPSELNKKFKPNLLVSLITIILVHSFILIPFFTLKIKVYSNAKKTTSQGRQSGGSIEI